MPITAWLSIELAKSPKVLELELGRGRQVERRSRQTPVAVLRHPDGLQHRVRVALEHQLDEPTTKPVRGNGGRHPRKDRDDARSHGSRAYLGRRYSLPVEAATSTVAPGVEPHVIKPAPRRPRLGLREVWRNRELLYFFAWRELKVRYKQTLLGVVWAVLQPLMYMVVFTLFFGRFLDVYSPGPTRCSRSPGSVIWLFFANSVTLAAGSLVGNASLLTKVYFPRLLAPLAPIFAALVDLALATLVLVAVMAAYGEFPAPQRVWTAIPFVLLAMGTAAGVGAWLAALNVKYRDIRFVVPFMLQLWLFCERGLHLVRRAEPRRAVGDAVLAQPDGRRRRGLPLGDARRRAAGALAHRALDASADSSCSSPGSSTSSAWSVSLPTSSDLGALGSRPEQDLPARRARRAARQPARRDRATARAPRCTWHAARDAPTGKSSWRSAASASTSRAARCSGSSAGTAPARPRC